LDSLNIRQSVTVKQWVMTVGWKDVAIRRRSGAKRDEENYLQKRR
jgi:hypothetical protein